jgi:hypothetical protein
LAFLIYALSRDYEGHLDYIPVHGSSSDRTFASHEETACIVRGMKLTFVVKELYGAPAAAIGPGNAQTPNPDSRTLNLYHLLRASVEGHKVWILIIPIRGKKEVIESFYGSGQPPQMLDNGVPLDIRMCIILAMNCQTAVPYTVTHVCTSFGRYNDFRKDSQRTILWCLV